MEQREGHEESIPSELGGGTTLEIDGGDWRVEREEIQVRREVAAVRHSGANANGGQDEALSRGGDRRSSLYLSPGRRRPGVPPPRTTTCWLPLDPIDLLPPLLVGTSASPSAA